MEGLEQGQGSFRWGLREGFEVWEAPVVGDSSYPLSGGDVSLCLPFRMNVSICTLFS